MTLLPMIVKLAAIAVTALCAAVLVRRMMPGPVKRFALAAGRGEGTEAYRPLEAKELWKLVIGLFLVTRLLIAAASLSYAAATLQPGQDLWWNLGLWWFEYDSYHYINIAEHGYAAAGEDAKLIVFYPLYPLLVKLVSFVITNVYVAGIVVSNACLLIAMYFLVRLTELEWRDRETAVSAAKYAVLFPFSFFFTIIYTESLFILLCILCFYCLRHSRWLLAGMLAMLAALTRNQGVLLALPMVIEMAASQMGWPLLREKRFREWGRRVWPTVLYAAMPALGIGLYLLLNRIVTGDWFGFLAHQKSYWGQTFGFYADNLAEHMNRALTYRRPLFTTGVYAPQMVMFFIGFVLLIYMANKARLSYLLFSFAYLIVSYSASAMLSGARYVSGMFTLYMFLAYLFGRMKMSNRQYVDWALLFGLLFFTCVFGLNYVF
ncbi:mannosyltransferase family protein [Paenibacillus cymbidii]|uniref:mannosyltransferase family protein n=1 Tax=Paenibacillus cymbidii TaxID=1639034 RepID=UPI0010801BD7|nr:mannosyltransferase family protein [Paenibacillus cymbidii]